MIAQLLSIIYYSIFGSKHTNERRDVCFYYADASFTACTKTSGLVSIRLSGAFVDYCLSDWLLLNYPGFWPPANRTGKKSRVALVLCTETKNIAAKSTTSIYPKSGESAQKCPFHLMNMLFAYMRILKVPIIIRFIRCISNVTLCTSYVGDVHIKFGEYGACSSGEVAADRQTDRQTDKQTRSSQLYCCQGGVKA